MPLHTPYAKAQTDPAHPLCGSAQTPPQLYPSIDRSIQLQTTPLHSNSRASFSKTDAFLCEAPRWPPALLSRPAAPTDGKPHTGRGLPKEKRGRLPTRVALAPSPWVGEAEEATAKRRRKRLLPDPRKVDRDPPHVAPPNPVSLTKATAVRAHHLVSANPSLKHETTTSLMLSSVKPSPGIKFRVAATRRATYRYTAGEEADYASRPLPTSGHCDESPNSPAVREPAADPDSAGPRAEGGGRRAARAASRRSGRRRSRQCADPESDPSPRPSRRRTPRASRPGEPTPQKDELAALQKSWTNFSGADGCGRGRVGLGGRVPRRWPSGGGAPGAKRQSAPTSPLPAPTRPRRPTR